MMPGFVPVGGRAGYLARAVSFDGSAYITRSSALSGMGNTKVGLFSCWIKVRRSNGETATVLAAQYMAGVTAYSFFRNVDDTFTIYVFNANGVGGTDMRYLSKRTITAADGWTHVVASWNVDIGAAQIYVDGISTLDMDHIDNATLSYNHGPVDVGRDSYRANRQYEGDMTEVYFTNERLDLSVPDNLAKFRTSSGRPRFLGINGELPTGNQPALYLTGPASTFHINKGYGGNFTVNGALTDAPTSP